MKIADLVVGNKYLYKNYNPYDHTVMEIAYEYLGKTNGTPTLHIFKYLKVVTDIPGVNLVDFKDKLVEYDEPFLVDDLKMGWTKLPDHYELIYV